MSGPLDGLNQIAQIAHPRTLTQLRRAGALGASTPFALLRTLPWLLGRGPSLGIIVHMNRLLLGDKTAIFDRRGTLSWEALDRRSDRAALALTNTGVGPSERVATLLRNGRELVEVAVGAQKTGVVACPLNTWAKPKELKAVLENALPVMLVYDTAHAELVESCAPEGIPLVWVGDESEALHGSLPYEELLAEQSTAPPSPFTRNRGTAKIIIQTSGTTGTPKGASRDAAAAGLGELANLLSVVPYRRDDIIYCPAPMFHSFGLITFTIAAALGSTLVLPERFDPEGSLQLMEKHNATAASFVPVMLRRILSLSDDVKKRYDVSRLRIILASGSVLTEDIRKGATDLFGEVLYDLYGSTEVGWVAIATPEDMRRNPKAVGRPVPGVDVVVFSEDGRRLGRGQTGELFIKSGIAFEGYISGETRDEREGHLSIGDLGYLDEEGYLFVGGRSDDMVVVGGENVYPVEIEQVIEDMPGVDEVAVMGLPDEEYGQVLAAYVSGSVTEDEIVAACKRELASYKVPRKIVIMDELPRTSTGKILKRELTAPD